MLPSGAGAGAGADSVCGVPVPMTCTAGDTARPACRRSVRSAVDWSAYSLPATVGKVRVSTPALETTDVTASVEAGSKGLVPAASSAPLLRPSPSSSCREPGGIVDLGVGDAVEHFPDGLVDAGVDLLRAGGGAIPAASARVNASSHQPAGQQVAAGSRFRFTAHKKKTASAQRIDPVAADKSTH